MQKNLIPILSTRKLSEGVMTQLSDAGFDVESLDFIATEPIDSPSTKEQIHAARLRPLVAIFTSKSAVESVAMINSDITPHWKIYCIGHTTKETAAHYFGIENIIHTAPNAMNLAQLLVQHAKAEELTFFCGDRRRDELPNILRAHNMPMKEIVVYNTQLTPHRVVKQYAGIIFYSPSTVQSFFKKNSLPPKAVLFALGHTTEAEIRKYSSQQIIISDLPSKKHLIRMVLMHFQLN